MDKRHSSLEWKNWLLVIIFMGVYLFPRLIDLGTYATADEPLYLKSAASFYYLMREGRFDETDMIVHPGIVNLWAGAAGFFVVFPEYANLNKTEYPIPDLHFREIVAGSGHTLLEMLVIGRAVTVLFQTLILGAALYFCQRIIGPWPALFGFLLISFDPFNFANSRTLQPDGILAASLLLSVTSFFDYLQNKRKSNLIASGIGAGLCWLSKLVGVVLGPMVLGIAVFFWWRVHQRDWRTILPITRDLVIWLSVALLIFVALWPVMWVEPLETLTRYLEQSFLMSKDVNSPMFFNGEVNPQGEFGFNYFYYYFLVLFNRTTPLILLGLVFVLAVKFLKPKNKQKDAQINFATATLAISLVIFLLLMSCFLKKADHYILSAFLILDLLAGAGYWLLINRIKTAFPKTGSSLVVVMILFVFGLQAFLVWRIAPYYHGYINPLWGNAKHYVEHFSIGYGEGLDQAARYLNAKEDMDDKVVYSWYSASFDLFFNKRSKEIHIQPSRLDSQFEEIMEADYAVIYISQWQRQPDTILLQFLADKQPEFTVEINGIEYVKVYNLPNIVTQAKD